MCRTQWDVPQDGIEVLPKNFAVKNLQTQLQNIRKERDQIMSELAALRQTIANQASEFAKSEANVFEAQSHAAENKDKLDKLRTSNQAEIETLQKVGGTKYRQNFLFIQTLIHKNSHLHSLLQPNQVINS